MAAAAPKLVLSLRLKNILFATDFSACSETAVPYVQSIASRFGSTVHVLHVLPPEAHLGVPLDPLPAKFDLERQVAEQLMARFLVRNPLKGVSHEVLVEREARPPEGFELGANLRFQRGIAGGAGGSLRAPFGSGVRGHLHPQHRRPRAGEGGERDRPDAHFVECLHHVTVQ